MRLPPRVRSTVSCLVYLIPSLASAVSIDCEHVQIQGKGFNFQALGGPHSVYTIDDHPPSYTNTTFTLDICQPLKRTSGVPKDEDCPNGSRVCAIARLYPNPVEEKEPSVEMTVPIAGEFIHEGRYMDPKWTLLGEGSSSNSDQDKEGIRLEMNGGLYGKTAQKAVVEFLCDAKQEYRKRDKGDSDGDGDGEDEDRGPDRSGEEQDDGQGGKLRFISWKDEAEMKILRLDWTTKYACEGAADKGDKSSGGGHWGFFTWLIIILFMGVAAYLIFGSWLNYNRYSARGWDVLPHSDTLQDLPYLFRDWMRRVVNTVQGGGSRGGYSAV